MQMEPAERPLVKLEALRLLHRLGLNPAQVQLISGFIDTYLKLNPAEEAAFQAELANILPTEQEGVMEIVTSWMERGIEQGREQGLEQGREQGLEQGREQGLEQGRVREALSLVERLLNRRFGSLSPSLQEAVRQLSVAQLEELAEALLDFENEADLEAWLNQRESQ
jgi:flagellar biosynthesis/type III secretory pathway protein FliH